MRLGDDSYVPRGPAESGRIRAYADAKLRHLSQAHDVLNDKTKFMKYMETLTNDILGVGSRCASPTAKVGRPAAQEQQLAPSSSSSSEQSAYVPQVISNDMREASYSALGKLQQIRRNVATMLGGGSDSRRVVQVQGVSSQAEVRHIESGYPFRVADGRQTATQAETQGGGGRENELPAAQNVQDSLSLPMLHREPSSPVRENPVVKSFDSEARDSDVFSRMPAAPVLTIAGTSVPVPAPVPVSVPVPMTDHALHAAAPAPVRDAASVPVPSMHDGELDFSGSWKGRPERGRYQEIESVSVMGWAPRPDAAEGASRGSPRPTLSMRGSVDLSEMTLTGYKDLTGHLP